MPYERVPTLAELAALVDRRVDTRSPAARLRAAIELGGELSSLNDDLVGRFVADARAAEMSWAEIGRVFGASKQAVQQRYGPTTGAPSLRPERWAAAVQDALVQARAEANALGHDFVGTEHALLALASAEHGAAGEVLRDLGVTRERMLATSCLQPRLGGPRSSEAVALMPRLKQALEKGLRVADGLEAGVADSEHLLAGIIAVPDSMAVEILRRLGVRSITVRAALAGRLGVEPQRLGAPRQRRRRLLATRRRPAGDAA